jgi:hypothetical protein
MKIVWPLFFYDSIPYDRTPQVIGSFKHPACLLKEMFLYYTGLKRFKKEDTKKTR